MRMYTCLFVVGVLAAAEPTPTETVRADFIRSLAGSPAVQAAHDRLVAAQAAARASGRLSDPTVGAGYARKSMAGSDWPIYDVSLEQVLPRWGERDALRASAAADVGMSEAELRESVGEVAADIASLLADGLAARAELAVVEREIMRVQSLRSAVTVRVAVGTGNLGDDLGLQTRRASLILERATLQQQVDDAEHEVFGLLALPPTSPLPPFSAPDRSSLSFDHMHDRVPAMLAAKAKHAAAAAEFRMARASRHPETAISLRYEHEPEPGNTSDTIGLEFKVSLPLWQGASGDLEDAAAARSRAADREYRGWQHRVRVVISRAQRASAVAATARQTAEEARVRIDAEYDAVVRQAATDNGPTMNMALDILDRLGEAERRVIAAEAAARQAEAGLWRIAPPDVTIITRDRTQP